MKKSTIISLFAAAFLFTACASKQPQPTIVSKVDAELTNYVKSDLNYTDLNKKDEEELIKNLLTNSPSFAQNNPKNAVKENMVKLPNNMPLFRQPLFAQMVVFPYVSDDGIYHGYSESWLKIKDGEFALIDPRNGEDTGDRIFDMNSVGNVK